MSKNKSDEQLGDKLELPPGVKLLRTLDRKAGILSIAFNPEGSMLASGDFSSYDSVKLWDVDSGELIRTFQGDTLYTNSVAFAPTGRIIAGGNGDSTVKLWDVDSGEQLHVLEGHEMQVFSTAFDPTGRTLASGSWDATVKLWDMASGKLIRTLECRTRKGHSSHVFSVAFDSTGDTLASGGHDGVKLWDVASGVPSTLGRWDIIWHEDCEYDYEEELYYYKSEYEMDERYRAVMPADYDEVFSLAFNPTGRILACGYGDSTVKLWDVDSAEIIRTLRGHTNHVEAVAFSVDGRLLASLGREGTLHLRSCETWETVAVIAVPKYYMCQGLALHPTLPLLATADSTVDSEYDDLRLPPELIHLWELDLDVLLGKVP